MTELFNPEKTNYVRELIKRYDLDPHLFQQACTICEASLQNGHSLDLNEGDKIVSVPMLAASIPDPHLLLAAYYYDAQMDAVNDLGKRPAHMIAVRLISEPVLAKKCALILHDIGVQFVDHSETEDPYSVFQNMPSAWTQWKGWQKKRKEAGKAAVPLWWQFTALLQNRRNIRAGRRLLSQLG